MLNHHREPLLHVSLEYVPASVRSGIDAISRIAPVALKPDKNLPSLVLKVRPGPIQINATEQKIEATCARQDIFRAIGVTLGYLAQGKREFRISEERKIPRATVMIDVSRNAVIRPEVLRDWIPCLALMGYTGIMLYAEDTYTLPGHPYFGYRRGRYSAQDLKQLDTVAHSVGIEMFPCIQTLAHLQRILQYEPYENMADMATVLMVGEKKTLEFIEAMIDAATRPFRSKRIHLGMDEAWGLGRGEYLKKHGLVHPFKIMVSHLTDVLALTRKKGLKPVIWSDMFFRALSPDWRHYDPTVKVTSKIAQSIPDDVQLIYWSYYGLSPDDYRVMIKKHRELGAEPIVAGGVQTWNHFWTAYPNSEECVTACLQACTLDKIQEVILTLWGDDGTECDYRSALPLLQFASDILFNGEASTETTARNCLGILGVNYADWRLAGSLDYIPALQSRGRAVNISKALLWDDPLLAFWSSQTHGHALNPHYTNIQQRLAKSLKRQENAPLTMSYLLARVLAIKCDLPMILRQAYQKKDVDALKKIMVKDVPECIGRIRQLQQYHRKMWHENYRSFGWEVLERRYGGLLAVFENLADRLNDYVNGKISSLEELDEKTLPITQDPSGKMAYLRSCSRLYTTGQLFHSYD